MSHEPDWASPGAATSEVLPDASSSTNLPNGNPVPRKDRSLIWQRLISFVIIGLSASMVAVGLSALFELVKNGFPNFNDFFIASYMILFAVLLAVYELMWWCTIDKLNNRIRKNFGFMYKISGKAAYLIFVSLLCVGLDREILGGLEWLQWFAGIGWAVMGILLMGLVCFQPHVFRNYQAPTGGYVEESGPTDNV